MIEPRPDNSDPERQRQQIPLDNLPGNRCAHAIAMLRFIETERPAGRICIIWDSGEMSGEDITAVLDLEHAGLIECTFTGRGKIIFTKEGWR
jgi:hypothetical protein